jgi:hypothetical protein
VILNWPRLHRDLSYTVEVSDSPEMNVAVALAVVTDTFFIDAISPDASDLVRFYRIIAGRETSLDEYVVLESFEETVTLTSYSVDQDQNPDAWQQVVDSATLGSARRLNRNS